MARRLRSYNFERVGVRRARPYAARINDLRNHTIETGRCKVHGGVATYRLVT